MLIKDQLSAMQHSGAHNVLKIMSSYIQHINRKKLVCLLAILQSDFLVPPRVVSRETEVSARTGSSAELECVAHGNPPPTIHWRKVHPNSQTQSLQVFLI